MKTLSYSEQMGAFQSAMTIDPNLFIEVEGELYFLSANGDIQIVNGDDYARNALLEFVVNQDFQYTKAFDNIEMYAGSKAGIDITGNFKTSYSSGQLIPAEISRREGTLFAAIPRDSDDGITRLRDKLLRCVYSIDNADKIKFSIPYIKTKYRYSLI